MLKRVWLLPIRPLRYTCHSSSVCEKHIYRCSHSISRDKYSSTSHKSQYKFFLFQPRQYHLTNAGKRFSSPTNSDINNCTMETDTNLKFQHNPDMKEFYIELDEGHSVKAVIQYEMVTPKKIEMYHTGVPPEFRGKGIAKLLAKGALDYAVEQDLDMILTCWYLQKYVKENPLPEYQKRVVEA